MWTIAEADDLASCLVVRVLSTVSTKSTVRAPDTVKPLREAAILLKISRQTRNLTAQQ